jgi:hypothetical protein
VIREWRWWLFLPWSRELNSGKWLSEGKKVSRKMSALELIAPLAVLAAAAGELTGKQIVFHVDNSGACNIWRRGYSTSCKLSTTIVRAMADIAAAVACHVHVEKVARCSDQGSVMADLISKGELLAFRRLAGPEWTCAPAPVPLALTRWAAKPHADDFLGEKIIEEIRGTTDTLCKSAAGI